MSDAPRLIWLVPEESGDWNDAGWDADLPREPGAVGYVRIDEDSQAAEIVQLRKVANRYFALKAQLRTALVGDDE